MSHSTQHQEQGLWARNITKVTFLSLTVLLFCTAIYLIRAELDAIILGLLLAGVLTPMHKYVLAKTTRLNAYIRNRLLHLKTPTEPDRRHAYDSKVQAQVRRHAAMVSVVLVFLIIVIPLTLFAVQLAKQGVNTLRSTALWLEQELPRQVPRAIEAINRHDLARKVLHDLQLFSVAAEDTEDPETISQFFQPEITENEDTPALPDDATAAQSPQTQEAPAIDSQRVTTVLVNASRNLFGTALRLLLKILSKTWLTVFNFFLMLFVMFFVFYDGENIMNYARSIIPLGTDEQQQVIQRIKEVSASITFSIFGTALCQALVAMVIFRIVGIPALFWGVMLGMCSIIPFVGTTLIWIPATIFLFATGQIWQGWFVLVSCGLIVANLDNVLRPFLMRKTGKTGMSYLVLFFAILGGLQTFGLIGIIYGPLIFGICGICLLIFSTQFKKTTHQ